MPHHVTGTVNPRPFAVPQAKDTVVFAFAAQFCLLRAPKGRRGKVFVQSRLKGDLRRVQDILGTGHLHVHGTKR